MLSELGLTGYEEKVYRALLAGASTAKKIAQKSGVPPTAVYPAVESLVLKELVQYIPGTLKRYEAINPKIGIKRLVQQQMNQLKETEKQLIDDLKYSPETIIDKSPITLTRGTFSSIQQSYDMMLDAKRNFYVIGWNFNRMKSVHEITKKIVALKKRNIDIRVLFTHPTEPGDILRKKLDVLKIPYRFIHTKYISIVIADGERCKITLKRKSLSEKVNMVIEDPDLAYAMQHYFLTLWKKGKKTH